MNPPITPKGPNSDPSARVIMPGMMVWYGRLPGASAFGWEGSREKFAPRFCSVKPHEPCLPAGTMPVPKPM